MKYSQSSQWEEVDLRQNAQVIDMQFTVRPGQGRLTREQLEAEFAEIEAMKAKLYAKDVTYRCPLCKDMGFVRADLPFGHPDLGKAIRCNGKAHQADKQRRMAALSQLSPSEADVTLENISPYHETLANNKCVECLGDIAPHRHDGQNGFKCQSCGMFYYDKPSSNLAMLKWAKSYILGRVGFGYCWGGWGNGKSEVAKAIVNDCNEAGRMSIYARWSDIVAYIKASWDKNATESEDERFRKLIECEVLVIDELDKVKESEWLGALRSRLFDTRYEGARRGGTKTTIVFSNLPPESLDGALLSRFRQDFGSDRIVKNTAPDLRQMMPY